jgi:phage terminase small subunit
MPTRESLRAKERAAGGGRYPEKENKDYQHEVLTEVPPQPVELVDMKAAKIWDEVCGILINRKVLKPAHFKDLTNYCNCMAYVAQIDDQLYALQGSLSVKGPDEMAKLLVICEKLSSLRKKNLDTGLTISSRFGLDALSERRFTVTQEKPRSPENGFLEL